MSVVLLDTHTWAWSLMGDHSLSSIGVEAISSADSILISPVSFFEIGQKVRIGKWPAMEQFVGQLVDLAEQQGGIVAALTPEISLRAALMPWKNRDPFDRLLAATAMQGGVPLISADLTFDTLPDLVRIW